MDQLKKTIQGLDGKTAFLINAAFAIVFIVLFLVLPLVSGGHKATMKGTDLFEGFGLTMISLLLLVLPVASVVYAYARKTLSTCIVATLAYTYLIVSVVISAVLTGLIGGLASAFGGSAAFNLGVGFYLCFIVVLLPWTAFCHMRKGLPAEVA